MHCVQDTIGNLWRLWGWSRDNALTPGRAQGIGHLLVDLAERLHAYGEQSGEDPTPHIRDRGQRSATTPPERV